MKSHLIYNLSVNKKKRKRLNFFKNFNGLKILNIGRLTDQKDQITLIKSLKILKKKILILDVVLLEEAHPETY